MADRTDVDRASEILGADDTSLRSASPTLSRVLDSAARLQRIVPDAALVGGSVAALYAGQRDSLDHDHVVYNLSERYDLVLDAVEAEDGWVTNRMAPGKLILDQLGDIETGVRQLIRNTPLEIAKVRLPYGELLTVPTDDETLRIKAFLVVRRNQTRDYLDVAALSERMGVDSAAATLADIDRFYSDQHRDGDGVASQLYRQLSDPRPKDSATTHQLHRYKNIEPRWQQWRDVVARCHELADAMIMSIGTDQPGTGNHE